MAAESRPDDRTLVMTREFAAPRALVFEAFTTIEHLKHWYAPDGMELDGEVDFRVGGALRLRMVGFGLDVTARGVYRDIASPERIVMAMLFDDVAGVEILQTVTLLERAGTTTLTMRMELTPWDRIPAAHHEAIRMRWGGASVGWSQAMEHLTKYLTR